LVENKYTTHSAPTYPNLYYMKVPIKLLLSYFHALLWGEHWLAKSAHGR